MDRHVRDRNGDGGQGGGLAVALAFQEKLTLSLPACRFPNLFPPLKPETVARRTVEAVQLNQALLLLPWTMHALIILKRYRAGEEAQSQAPSSQGTLVGKRPQTRERTHMID